MALCYEVYFVVHYIAYNTPTLLRFFLWALHNALAQFQDYASWSCALSKPPGVLQPELNPGIFQ